MLRVITTINILLSCIPGRGKYSTPCRQENSDFQGRSNISSLSTSLDPNYVLLAVGLYVCIKGFLESLCSHKSYRNIIGCGKRRDSKKEGRRGSGWRMSRLFMLLLSP